MERCAQDRRASLDCRQLANDEEDRWRALQSLGAADVTDIAAKLDELIATVRASSSADLYLDAAGVAAVLGFSHGYTRDKIVHQADFPAPLRMGDGHARWLRSEVIRWAKSKTKRSAA